MSEETKDQDAADQDAAPQDAAGAETATAVAEEEDKSKRIQIELEDLTEEGKKKAEEATHRTIEDIGYTLVSREDQPGSVLALKFEVAREAYEAEQTRLFKDLQKEATLPGFRKGKAPIKLLQIRMGEEALRDTVRQVATNVLRQETLKQGFKFIIRPEVKSHAIPEDGGPVAIEIDGEVEPKIELKQYQGLKVEVEVRPVTDAMVEQRLEALRKENAVVENAPEGAQVNPGDAIVVDLEVRNSLGELMENLSKTGQLLYDFKSQLPEPLTGGIVGKKAGETVQADIEHKATNRRGEEVVHTDHYTLTVREIKMNKLPALDDEFAKDLGEYATLEDLKVKTRQTLEEAETERQRGEALHKLYHELLEHNPIDTPRSLLAHQTYRQIMEDQHQLSRMGLRLEQVVHDTEKYLADQRSGADERVKVQLLLNEIGKAEKLQINDEDVEKEIEAVAEKTGRKPLAVRARLEAQKQLDQFRDNLAARKLSDFLLSKNTVEHVPMREKTEEIEGETQV